MGLLLSVDEEIDSTAAKFIAALDALLSASKISSRMIAERIGVPTHKIKGLRYCRIKPTLAWCNAIYNAYAEIVHDRCR